MLKKTPWNCYFWMSWLCTSLVYFHFRHCGCLLSFTSYFHVHLIFVRSLFTFHFVVLLLWLCFLTFYFHTTFIYFHLHFHFTHLLSLVLSTLQRLYHDDHFAPIMACTYDDDEDDGKEASIESDAQPIKAYISVPISLRSHSYLTRISLLSHSYHRSGGSG